jgi:hypothetical protein
LAAIRKKKKDLKNELRRLEILEENGDLSPEDFVLRD